MQTTNQIGGGMLTILRFFGERPVIYGGILDSITRDFLQFN